MTNLTALKAIENVFTKEIQDAFNQNCIMNIHNAAHFAKLFSESGLFGISKDTYDWNADVKYKLFGRTFVIVTFVDLETYVTYEQKISVKLWKTFGKRMSDIYNREEKLYIESHV